MATTIKSTALDFNNIKNNLKSYLANQTEFSDYNFEASGLSNILDVLAYNTHINALIANFALNESYLNTAQLRSSVVSLAEGIGFIPNTDTASQALVRISFTTSTTPRDNVIALPAYTQFTAEVDDVTYTFQTIETYYATDNGNGFYEFKDADGSNQIPLYEGTNRTKTFLAGEYEDNPIYVIPDSTIDGSTVAVNIYESATSTDPTAYQNVKNVVTVSSNSAVYILRESPNGYFELSFGDGETFGLAPQAGNRIEVIYLSTKGAVANGATTFTPSSTLTAGGLTATLSVQTVSNSTGGEAKQTIESIKKNAPFQYVSQNRMVTASDYSALILSKYSTFIKDIVAWGGEDNASPEFGSVYISILFEDNVPESQKDSIKRGIVDLGESLAITSFNIRFLDPVQTFIELDTFFQFNPALSDKTLNAIQNDVITLIDNYFGGAFGIFNKSFRRSNLLTDIDDLAGAILSSRADVRMQQRFIPSAPSAIAVINNLTLNSLDQTQLDYIVDLLSKRKYDAAASYLVNNQYTTSNYTVTRSRLASTSLNTTQTLTFPVGIAAPDDENYRVRSTEFTLNGRLCLIRNKLETNILQVVAVNGDVIVDNVGNYNAGDGTVVINYFNPSNIAGGRTDIKLSVTPANQSAIAPIRNELLVYDKDRSSTTGVIVTADN